MKDKGTYTQREREREKATITQFLKMMEAKIMVARRQLKSSKFDRKKLRDITKRKEIQEKRKGREGRRKMYIDR